MANHPVPKASIDTLREIIEGYYEAGEIGEVVDHGSVEEEVEASRDVIRRQKRFLADLGVLDKDGHDYLLHQKGAEIGRALAFERNEEARKEIGGLLEAWEVTEELVEDMGQEEVDEETLTDSIAYITETDPSTPRKKTGLSALVDLYMWTGILEKSGEDSYRVAITTDQDDQNGSDEGKKNKTSLSENGDQSSDSKPHEDGKIGKKEISSGVHAPADAKSNTNSISITMELSGEEDPANVKKLIIAVRQGLQADLRGPEKTSDETGHEELRPLHSYDNK